MEYLEDDLSKIYQILREYDDGFIEALEFKQKELYDVLSVSKFNAIVDELSRDIDGEIAYLIQRWGAPHSTFQWRLNVDLLKREFEVNDFFNRKAYGLD